MERDAWLAVRLEATSWCHVMHRAAFRRPNRSWRLSCCWAACRVFASSASKGSSARRSTADPNETWHFQWFAECHGVISACHAPVLVRHPRTHWPDWRAHIPCIFSFRQLFLAPNPTYAPQVYICRTSGNDSPYAQLDRKANQQEVALWMSNGHNRTEDQRLHSWTSMLNVLCKFQTCRSHL